MIKTIFKWLRKWKPVTYDRYERANNIAGRLSKMEVKSDKRYEKLNERLDEIYSILIKKGK